MKQKSKNHMKQKLRIESHWTGAYPQYLPVLVPDCVVPYQELQTVNVNNSILHNIH